MPPLPLDPPAGARNEPLWAEQRRTRRQGFGTNSIDSIGSFGSTPDSDFNVDFGSDWSDAQQPDTAPRLRRQLVIGDNEDDDDDSDLVQFQPHSVPDSEEEEDEGEEEEERAVVRRQRRPDGQPGGRASSDDAAGLAAAAAASIAAPTSQWMLEEGQAPGSAGISDAETRARTSSQASRASTPGEPPVGPLHPEPPCVADVHAIQACWLPACLAAALPTTAVSHCRICAASHRGHVH